MGCRIITTELATEGTRFEQSLRSQRLQEYIGQKKLKPVPQVYINVARQRRGSLNHMPFHGSLGPSKTTLSGIIANEMDAHMRATSGPAVEKPGDMATILNHLQEGDVFFVDKIRRLSRRAGEILHPAMEDFVIDIVFGKESNAKSIHLALPHFTLIRTATGAGLPLAPLRDRFDVVQRLEFYEQDGLQGVVLRSVKVLDVEIDAAGSAEITRRSRGTLWLASRPLRHVRDFAEVRYSNAVMEAMVYDALNPLDVDTCSLDAGDRTMLNLIIDMFRGGPVGLDILAAALGEDAGTLEEVYKPYLLMQGFLIRTSRGRATTEYACSHLSRKKEDEEQADAQRIEQTVQYGSRH